jgi:hypoxanthine-DNA glycosylase
MNATKYIRRVSHPFAPLIDKDCETLIVGSIASDAGRSAGFYYAHKSNRFWKLLSKICNTSIENLSPQEKTDTLLKNKIGVCSAIVSCDIRGCDDNSIANAEIRNLREVIEGSKIKKIVCEGHVAHKYTLFQCLDVEVVRVPSASGATRMKYENVENEWLNHFKGGL